MGASDSAMDPLLQGLQCSSEMGEKRWRWQILKLLAELDGSEQGDEWRREAVAIVRTIAERAGDPELGRQFLLSTDLV